MTPRRPPSSVREDQRCVHAHVVLVRRGIAPQVVTMPATSKALRELLGASFTCDTRDGLSVYRRADWMRFPVSIGTAEQGLRGPIVISRSWEIGFGSAEAASLYAARLTVRLRARALGGGPDGYALRSFGARARDAVR
jgi:hypothetical protein